MTTFNEAVSAPMPGQGGRTPERIVRHDFPPEATTDVLVARPMVEVIDHRRMGHYLVRGEGASELIYSAVMTGWTRHGQMGTPFGSPQLARDFLASLPLPLQAGARIECRDFSRSVIST